ncbi:MAG TPA: glycosyltransferase family 2 protein [Candidatus Omnitrophota bacterium]|nr:glycosyltransferase family 2 protein [Candidatus Omnitrophota bacterium]HPS37301.1 glycosyltransferase family 2 protein [Candidatus Omnitrophota bacterium]
MNPKILVIVPSFNEAASIRHVVEEARTVFPCATLLVINDNSADNTEEEALKSGALVATLPSNLGIGGAMQTGYQIALEEDYDIAVQLDGDGQHDPAFLKTLIAPILENKLDFCIGSRFLDPSSPSFRSTWLRRIGILFFCRLLGLLTGLYLTDPTSGFRAVGKKLIRIFASYYPVDFPEPESIQAAKRLGARIGEVPVLMRERQGGISSIRYLRTFYFMIKVTLAILIDTLKKKN